MSETSESPKPVTDDPEAQKRFQDLVFGPEAIKKGAAKEDEKIKEELRQAVFGPQAIKAQLAKENISTPATNQPLKK